MLKFCCVCDAGMLIMAGRMAKGRGRRAQCWAAAPAQLTAPKRDPLQARGIRQRHVPAACSSKIVLWGLLRFRMKVWL